MRGVTLLCMDTTITTMTGLLELVKQGHVVWLDPTPCPSARFGWSLPRWHIDGVEAHGPQVRSLDRLAANGAIDAAEEETARVASTMEVAPTAPASPDVPTQGPSAR